MGNDIPSQRWTVRPRNTSDVGIHGDETAQRLGFEGAFVPGVTVYEHLVVGLLQHDPAWLSHGRVEMHFRRPVYDNEAVELAIDGEAGAWSLWGAADERPRAYGLLHVDDDPPVVPSGEAFGERGQPLGDPAQIGALMELSAQYGAERIQGAALASGFPMAGPHGVVPVGLWTNPVDLVRAYFDQPTTIHLDSRIWHYSPLQVGEVLLKRGQIVRFEERRGSQVVHYTAELTASGRLIARIAHASVYRLASEG